jgi:hypothetical protein
MVDEKKDLRELIAVDMPNGFTYIGRNEKINIENKPLVLKESFMMETSYLTQSRNNKYIQFAKERYADFKKEELEEKIIIDNPGPIHFLK